MPEKFTNRLKHAWNAFKNRDPTYEGAMGLDGHPDRIESVSALRAKKRLFLQSIRESLWMLPMQRCFMRKWIKMGMFFGYE